MKLLKPRRGRPIGWRKRNARRKNLNIRINEAELAKVRKIARREKISVSRVICVLIEEAR